MKLLEKNQAKKKLIKTKNNITIIGLGNPGYNESRHNVGFSVIDSMNLNLKKKLFKPYLYKQEENLILVKPLTYMNKSGEVLELLKRTQELIIVVDNMDLDVGTIRFKQSSKKSTHNGLRSINKYLRSDLNYYIMHIGISKPREDEEIVDYVLSKEEEKKELLNNAIDKAATLLLSLKNKEIEEILGTYRCS